MPHKVIVIGGGPAGLMAAEVLVQHGVQVDLYDAMPSVGRKLLMAGKGGLNISHSEPFDQFISRYGIRQNELKPLLEAFNPNALREWVHGLGITTFIGSSGRLFPAEMKAAPLLRSWLRRLRLQGVHFYVKHQWLGWCDREHTQLRFATPEGERRFCSDAVILALGGGSWPKLGSTGEWQPLLLQEGVKVAPLKPSNCGFNVNWSEHFRSSFAGKPLKSVAMSFITKKGDTITRKGELIITKQGIEGGIVYVLSAVLRDEIEATGKAVVYLDLAPDKNLHYLIDKLSAPQGKQSLSNHLRKRIGMDGVKAGCLREIASQSDYNDPVRLCSLIKALPITLVSTRPLDEAISSAGGVTFESLNEQLMIRSMPGVFCAGEMLDWEAPTGGYLLSACFASGRKAAQGVLNWLKFNESEGEKLQRK